MDKITPYNIFDKGITLVAMSLAVWAVWSVSSKADKAEVKATTAQLQIEQQKEGRRTALDILCGGVFGVETAGRLVLLDRLPLPAPQGKHQTTAEEKLRMSYARAYASVISEAVIVQAGGDVKNILRRDGTIDCAKLKVAASATESTKQPKNP